MNLKEVHRALNDIYQKELTNGRKRHVVFWYDEEGEFVDDIDTIDLTGVRMWKVTPNNLFATKYELEKKYPESHFLLYTNMPKPGPREDWLLDIYKLAYEFATDKITVIMRELGINDDSLRETFKTYKTFFNSKARFQAFARFSIDSYTHEAIDLTVLAALTKSKTNGIDDIVKALMKNVAEGDFKEWNSIQKYGNVDTFWELIEKYYGYTLPEKTLQSLAIFLMLTYASQSNQHIAFPETWQKYFSARPTNVIVFMDQWMNHKDDRDLYNMLADQLAEVVKVEHYAEDWDMNDMVSLDGFRIFDQKIIQYIAGQLINHVTDFNTYLAMISTRRKHHWYPEYAHEYEAIHHGIQLLRRLHDMDNFIPEQSSDAMFKTYVSDYYQIDAVFQMRFDMKLPTN